MTFMMPLRMALLYPRRLLEETKARNSFLLPKRTSTRGRSATTCITKPGSWKTYSPFRLKARRTEGRREHREEIRSTTSQLCLAKKLRKKEKNQFMNYEDSFSGKPG